MSRVLMVLFVVLSFQTLAQVDIQGHRGARGLLPENTIPAFIRAIDEGVTTLELDVVITKDKRVVLSHEPFMSSAICLTPKGGQISSKQAEEFNIYEMTYEEVALFDCGSKGNKRFPEQETFPVVKPLLSDMIDEVETYLKENNLPNVSYNIELKSSPKGDGVYHPLVEEFSDIVAGLLEQKLDKSRYTIQCFDFRVLKYWHKTYPEITLVALIENSRGLEANLNDLGFLPSIYSPYHILVNKKLIEECHAQSIKVVPWTVNTRKRMDALIDMGVDGIITDYPNLAKGIK